LIPADIIITATGLDLQMFGGANLRVDGKSVNISDSIMYKGLMLENIYPTWHWSLATPTPPGLLKQILPTAIPAFSTV
jgi:cation diffusion facilitator CzcD-associated flavoprotein CzcO